MAISAVVALGAIGDPLVKMLKNRAAKIKVGPGGAEGVEMGPLVTQAHRDKVGGYIDTGVAEGTQLVLDGRNKNLSGDDRHDSSPVCSAGALACNDRMQARAPALQCFAVW